MNFLHGIAIALDYCVEMLLRWKKADPMTVSTLCGLALRRGEKWTALALLGKVLNFISTGHCEGAIAADTNRLQTALNEINSTPSK